MARKKKEYYCTVQVTEGFADRLTEGLVDVYYNLKKEGLLPTKEEIEKYEKEKTA